MDWMLMPYKRYAEFTGRSRRKEYWMFQLFILIVYIVLFALGAVLGESGGAVAVILLLIFMFFDGTPGENQYGQDPKLGER
ncbi:MAG: DUF805 domain-containing protein [Sphingomonadaceae bacterium]|nr:DUF805 domain-containing protein [Sphingomonadaceae bacterium]